MRNKNHFKDDANGEMLSIYSGDLSMLFKVLPETIKFVLDEKHKRVKFEFECVNSSFKLGDTVLSFKQFDESAKYIRKNSKRWLTKRKDRITAEDIKREEERDADFDKLYELQNPVEKEKTEPNILKLTQEDIDRFNNRHKR